MSGLPDFRRRSDLLVRNKVGDIAAGGRSQHRGHSFHACRPGRLAFTSLPPFSFSFSFFPFLWKRHRNKETCGLSCQPCQPLPACLKVAAKHPAQVLGPWIGEANEANANFQAHLKRKVRAAGDILCARDSSPVSRTRQSPPGALLLLPSSSHPSSHAIP